MPDTDPTKRSADALEKGSADVVAALKALRKPPDDEIEEARLLRAGISAMRNFYSTFFSEVYGAVVDGFGWEDKRKAVGAILEREPEEDDDEDQLAQARYELATLFEDLSDDLTTMSTSATPTMLRFFGSSVMNTFRPGGT